jgi:hypothetical protein
MNLQPGIYRHYKNILVRVVFIATHSETNEQMVVYVHLDDGRVWVRPLAMFIENVTVDGHAQPRFEYVKEQI